MIDDGCGKIISKSILYKPNQFPVFAPELWKFNYVSTTVEHLANDSRYLPWAKRVLTL